ncbi:hypothetical protein DM01DRAFT_1334330 [Hesseltinella vesiculosa]|uniref:GRHL1/CP2 C-terminal domain-containing protein n=1 Tax=Hesseltinella vesiculosa TaxID=101127 RepID=A0A1X2GMY4_9FUNG|nr:hypothetical protein DM01DRAFT_1334330 [Hesseltinella vesiculosa]
MCGATSLPASRNFLFSELSVYVQFEDQDVYRALYLEELTVHHLKEKILEKMSFENDDRTRVKDIIRKVANKSGVTVTMDDDDTVLHIPEEQTMSVVKKYNDDGSITIVLGY